MQNQLHRNTQKKQRGNTTSKMMNHVAYSTPEGELARICYGLRSAGSPGMVLWESVSGQKSETTPPPTLSQDPPAILPPAPQVKPRAMVPDVVDSPPSSASSSLVVRVVESASAPAATENSAALPLFDAGGFA